MEHVSIKSHSREFVAGQRFIISQMTTVADLFGLHPEEAVPHCSLFGDDTFRKSINCGYPSLVTDYPRASIPVGCAI